MKRVEYCVGLFKVASVKLQKTQNTIVAEDETGKAELDCSACENAPSGTTATILGRYENGKVKVMKFEN